MKDNQGPLFPIPLQPGQSRQSMTPCDGMSLRDYFAAKALQGLLAHPDCGDVGPGNEDVTNGAALEAYFVADAMLKARKQ